MKDENEDANRRGKEKCITNMQSSSFGSNIHTESREI